MVCWKESVPMVVHMWCVMYVHTHKVIAHFGTTVVLILGQGFFPEFNFMLGCAMALCHRWSMYVFSNYALNNWWRMCVQNGQNSCCGFKTWRCRVVRNETDAPLTWVVKDLFAAGFFLLQLLKGHLMMWVFQMHIRF
jgi:hypothetical protein